MTTKEYIIDNIVSKIAVGLRKGVDSKESCLLYRALNPLFFFDDEAVSQIGMDYVNAIAEATFELFQQKADSLTIGKAMKKAAVSLPVVESGAAFKITPYAQGYQCVLSMLPLYRDERCKADMYEFESDPDNAEPRLMYLRNEKWEFSRFLSNEDHWIAGAVILALAEEFPEVKAKFATQLQSNELKLRQALHDASANMCDEDWSDLAAWILY